MGEFPEFLDHKTSRGLEEEFRRLEKEEAQGDPWLLWRLEVNSFLSGEGIAVTWVEEDHHLVLVSLSGDTKEQRVKVPLLHLVDLWEQNAHPKGVASYLKAIMYDSRFRLWRVDGEDEED